MVEPDSAGTHLETPRSVSRSGGVPGVEERRSDHRAGTRRATRRGGRATLAEARRVLGAAARAAERVQRDDRLHRRAVDQQRRRLVHVRRRGRARSAPAGESRATTAPGRSSIGERGPGPARGRDPRGAELPGVPVLPERLLDDDPGARPDLDPGARAHDVERGLQPHPTPRSKTSRVSPRWRTDCRTPAGTSASTIAPTAGT